jgi:hypothetical protein
MVVYLFLIITIFFMINYGIVVFAKTLVARNYQPLFLNFLYTYSCSIKLFG